MICKEVLDFIDEKNRPAYGVGYETGNKEEFKEEIYGKCYMKISTKYMKKQYTQKRLVAEISNTWNLQNICI